MKKIGLFALAILLVSTFAPLAFAAGGPIQPPVDTTTLYSTTITWGPAHAFPGRAYDTASAELIFNVYDTLISMGESVTNYLGAWNTYESYWAFTPSISTNVPTRQEVTMAFPDAGLNLTDPISFWFQIGPTWYHIEQWVDAGAADGVFGAGDIVYIGEYTAMGMLMIDAITIRTWHVIGIVGGLVTVHHYYYDFIIPAAPTGISFVDNTGAVVDTFDINDLEYTFEVELAHSGSPTWMFNIPMFDQWYVSGTLGMGAQWGSVFWAKMILDAFEIMPGNVFRMNIGMPFADGAFKQILTQSWASIMSKEFLLSHGEFNPVNFFVDSDVDGIMDWYDTGFTTYPRVRGVLSVVDAISPTHYVGTGPYRVTTADSTIEGGLVVFEQNPVYWKGFAGKHLQRIQVDYVTDWAIRKQLFLDGKSDVTAVPRSNMFELLDSFGDPVDPKIKTVKSIVPVLSMDALFYTWDVDITAYNSLYTGVFPTGAPTNFMNSVHIRNAFTYAFNRTKYIQEAWYSEGICRETPGILGLIPDYYTKGDGSIAKPWKFNYNLALMAQELQAADADFGGNGPWAMGGFHIDIFYNAGNEPRRIACELIQAGFAALTADPILNPTGKQFIITIQAPDWATYLGYMEASTMPVWGIGWLADYADSGNWYGPYMHTYGDFAIYQKYPATTLGPRTGLNKDVLIDTAFMTPDGTGPGSRGDMYADLDDIYLTDNPGFPIIQPQGRRWQQYWVKGWYYNALYPATYYYHIYKEDTCWADVTGATAGTPDLKTDMRDISYIAGHFGAKAPNPGALPPQPIYDPKWAPGRYGYGGCDLAGDRKVDMRDIAFAAAHFLHTAQP